MAASTPVFTKDPNSVLDFALDWRLWLPDGDSLTGADWTVPEGITQPRPAAIDGTKAVLWLAGGTVGKTYTATCHVTTADGREEDGTLLVRIQQR